MNVIKRESAPEMFDMVVKAIIKANTSWSMIVGINFGRLEDDEVVVTCSSHNYFMESDSVISTRDARVHFSVSEIIAIAVVDDKFTFIV